MVKIDSSLGAVGRSLAVSRMPQAVMLLRFSQRSGCSPGRTKASLQRLKCRPSRLVMYTASDTPLAVLPGMRRSGTKRLGKPM